jgi:hypothetical protein
VKYFVTVDGRDAVDSGALEPGFETLQTELAKKQMAQCGCKASKSYQLFLEDGDAASKSSEIKKALKSAWSGINPSMENDPISFVWH